jgi:hypothetical protein
VTFIEDVADGIKMRRPDTIVGILTPTNEEPVVMVKANGKMFVVSVQELALG